MVQPTYEVVKAGGGNILKLNYETSPYVPSIENNPLVMMDVIDKLVANPSVQRVVFSQRRNFEYGFDQTQLLREIANLYSYLLQNKKVLSLESMGLPSDPPAQLSERFEKLRDIVFNKLRTDPIAAYVELKRVSRDAKVKSEALSDPMQKESMLVYTRLLDEIEEKLANTRLVKLAEPDLAGFELGDRSIYNNIFRPTITPDFMFTQIMASPPLKGDLEETYEIGEGYDKSEVSIYSVPNDIKKLYHLTPPEFKLSEEKYELIDLAKKVLSEHQPRDEEFLDPEKMRSSFRNISKDLLKELSDQRNISLTMEELESMAQILIRHTIGFGIIEILLQDQNIQDITINSPMGEVPIFVLHSHADECYTNIIPSRDDYESWASKFRLLSGRPFDEANPILDTELLLPNSKARVALINKPLNPTGIAMAFRRHADKPWTLAKFIKVKFISPEAAGLMSFLVDGNRTMLVAGTRSSGKTSLLGALLIEIMRKYRIITVEDSVTGDCEILIKKHGKIERTTVGKLIDSQIEKYGCWYELSEAEVLGNEFDNIEVLSLNTENKIKWQRVSKFIRHQVNKNIYKITTATGREIKVTEDHSLFSLGKNGKIEEAKVSELKENDFLATNRTLPWFSRGLSQIDAVDYPQLWKKCYFKGDTIKNFIQKYKYEIKQLGKEHNYKKAQINIWIREGYLPGKILDDLYVLGHSLENKENIKIKISGISRWLSSKIVFDEDFLTFVGLWIADGCYDRNSVIMSVSSEEEQALVKRIAERFNLPVKKHSDNFSLMLNSKTLKYIMYDLLKLRGNAYTKRMPSWVFELGKKQIGWLLKGLFSGDGHASKKEIVIPLASKNLLKDLQTLLLIFGIRLRVGKMRKDKTINAGISTVECWKLFMKHIGFLQKKKKERLSQLCKKKSTHDSTDIIPLDFEDKLILKENIKDFKYRDYIIRNNNIGRKKLQSITSVCEIDSLTSLQTLANSDVFWDKIRKIELYSKSACVYDFSVPKTENFVCENIIAHNTLELPTENLQKLGYNVQPLKVRSALVAGSSELSASEGIRSSLRMGDSALIVGEVRSEEALSLYEAMRIGALANVVAGTIHGDSPYGVFDRVVNDLKVPRTSFKATDIILVANPIRSADGLHKHRRVTQITEVRKHWEDDPLREKGFVDLMKYNPETDMLEVTPELMNGESDVLKSIGANVKEWVGDWDAIWNNIILRGNLKKMLVDYSIESNDADLLEAEFVVQANDMFHRISDNVYEETGKLDSKKIAFEWEEWLKREIRKRKM